VRLREYDSLLDRARGLRDELAHYLSLPQETSKVTRLLLRACEFLVNREVERICNQRAVRADQARSFRDLTTADHHVGVANLYDADDALERIASGGG
jgi:hypothetical protein